MRTCIGKFSVLLWIFLLIALLMACGCHALPLCDSTGPLLSLSWEDNYLTIHGDHLPGKSIRIHYLEAYCRAGSTDADWIAHTKIPHRTQLVDVSPDERKIRLRCTVADGLIVDHTITAGYDEIDFRLSAHNPTDKRSEAHWVQPCVRLGVFTGFGPGRTDDDYAYLPKCFIFLDGQLTRMPTPQWATVGYYTPGQVWRPKHVPPDDVNPRPVNPLTSSHGLIGCFSGDNALVFATAWEPYQELFQGVARCLHSDFRLGGVEPHQTKTIRGKIYLLPNDIPELLRRYRSDFPEH